MTPLRHSLAERRKELDTHFALARALEDQIFEGQTVLIGETEISVRHLMTMKSGLVVHLYNIVEATMSGVMTMVGRAIGSVPPTQWTENSLNEWLRKHAATVSDGGEEGRLEIARRASRYLLRSIPLEAHTIKKPSGSWDDATIYTLAKRLGVNLKAQFPPEVHRQLKKRPDLRDMTPPGFVADRRNAIAHGRRTFEDGAKELVLSQIAELADIIFSFLGYVVDAFDAYVSAESYRVVNT